MAAWLPPIAPGSTSTDASLAADLGRVTQLGTNMWRLVKSSTALAAATIASTMVKDTSTTGVLNWITGAVASGASSRILGFVPANQVAVASGGYFLVQLTGVVQATSGGSTAGDAQVTAAGGKLVDVSATYAATTNANICAVCLETATDTQIKTFRLTNLY